MLKEARKVLRISTETFDGEIRDIINAGKKDLKLAGVEKINVSDPLIKRALLTYVKANFGCDNDSEKYQRSYDRLKLMLRESREYKNA